MNSRTSSNTHPLARLHAAGQSIWLDSISRALLDSGTLAQLIENCSVTGLTSNPTIFDQAIQGSSDYDEAIRALQGRGLEGEALFFELALDDIGRAADLFRPIHERSNARDGFVSLEVSPTLADDTAGTVAQARDLFARAGRANVMIKVPGTPAGCVAIEELIATGMPINVTLLFDDRHYRDAAEAYARGLERRLDAGLDLNVPSVASVFISRWDTRTAGQLPADLKNKLGVAIGERTHAAYRAFLASDRWQRLARAGARPQRLLWASTGVKDPNLPATGYVTALAAPDTVNTMPDATLRAFAKEGVVGKLLDDDATTAERTLARMAQAGLDLFELADTLQAHGKDAFVQSWSALLNCIENKSRVLTA